MVDPIDLSEHLLHRLGEGVCCLDPAGACTFVNQAALSMLGFQREELVDRHCRSLFECGADLPWGECRCAVVQTVLDGQWRQGELQFRRKDGALLLAQLSVSPLAQHERGHSVVIVFRDISEQKRTEAARQAQAQRLAEQNRIMARFAACEAVGRGDVYRVALDMSAEAAQRFEIDRVGVWLFNASGDALRCVSMFDRASARHESGGILLERHFGPEFEGLRSSRFVDVRDALHDPRTAGYVGERLLPHGVVSLLDCAIHSGGRVLGMLGLEYRQQRPAWEPDEIAFGCALADQVGMAVLNAERIRAEAELRLSELRHRAISGLTSDLLFSCIRNGDQMFTVDWMTGACEAIFGISTAELLARGCWRCFVHPEDLPEFDRLITRLEPGQASSGSLRILRTDGGTRHVQVYAKVEQGGGENAHRLFGACRDVTEHKALEGELIRLANTDALTGVANRRRFLEQMEMELARVHRYGEVVCVLIMDVDHFKRINDSHGHAAGDAALRHLATLAQTHLRRNDLFGRLGGEEFGILLPGTCLQGALEYAERFCHHVAQSPVAAGVRLTVSIGAAAFKAEDASIDQVFARADAALYRAKEGGRNRVESETGEA
ncbi:MAG: diguanylate cyclase [Betaproteobacteria bacterium]|nr:diguanylate cyclase [Betaproteobacteria bacterium]